MYANQCSIPKPQCEPKRVGSVESAAMDLDNTAGRLSALASALADRLEPVLRPPSVGAEATPEANGYSAPLARRLQSGDRELNRVEDMLRDLLDRLEV